ncbi:uncharacterized protein TNCV_3006841 [Trichonephila clavipes]|nr:uncharacterized protein TNCV_3006841 [Trichonephila clavipes]
MVSVKSLLDQCRHRTTIVFGNLGRWPDRVTYYEQDYPYTIIFEPNFVHIPLSFGKTVIVFTSYLDLTWDKGVELRFFQVGRPPSLRVWEAHQPQTTDAYILDFTDCTRVTDVYVKWLTWLDDWEMHRDDNVPWRMVGLQPWKRALENTCSARMKRLWPMGCHLTSRSSTYFAHANVFHHDGKPVPIKLSIAMIRSDGSDPEVICITVNHAGQTSKPKDVRSNCQENARLRLVHHPLPKCVPVECLPFCVRGKFNQLARGNRGLMVVKGVEQQNFFQELGLTWPSL